MRRSARSPVQEHPPPPPPPSQRAAHPHPPQEAVGEGLRLGQRTDEDGSPRDLHRASAAASPGTLRIGGWGNPARGQVRRARRAAQVRLLPVPLFPPLPLPAPAQPPFQAAPANHMGASRGHDERVRRVGQIAAHGAEEGRMVGGVRQDEGRVDAHWTGSGLTS